MAHTSDPVEVHRPPTVAEPAGMTVMPLVGRTVKVIPLKSDESMADEQERGMYADVLDMLVTRAAIRSAEPKEYDAAGNWLNAHEWYLSQEVAKELELVIEEFKADFGYARPETVITDAALTINLNAV